MIGIFDSGLGGLTVVKEIFRVTPNAPILYLGDLARMPYGSKSKETIERYAEEDVKFLLNQGADIIVIACNTASSLAYDHLCKKFPNVPILEVVTPAAKAACEVSKNKKIGVIGTRGTISSGIYEKKIKAIIPDAQVFSASAPLLVPLIEEGWLDKTETKTILKKYLHVLKKEQVDTLILGCTHFPLIKNEIQRRIGKRVHLVDSAQSVVEILVRELKAKSYKLKAGEESSFFVTDLTPHWQTTAEKWLGRKIKLELVNL